jgi:hypothetical protein
MKKNQKITNLAKLFTNKPSLLINDLNTFYIKFQNKDKIIKLLIIWLSQYNFFCTTYIKLKDFKKIVSTKKSILKSASKISNDKFEITSPKKNIIFSFISLFVASFLKQFFLRGGYRLEKESFYLRFLFFISQFFLRYLPSKTNHIRKEALIYILSNYLNKIDLKYLNLALPDIFFSEEIKLFFKKDKHINTSPNAFWDFDGYEKILLIENKICISGYQHGGGYELKKDLLKFSEIIMSDYYYFWGFGDLNIFQHRYKRIKKHNLKHNKINRILWIERSNLPEMFKFLIPDFFKENNDSKIINFIENELKDWKREKFRIPHKLRLSNLYQNSNIKIISDERIPDLIIKNNDLVIFDHINHSLIYFCLCRNITFLCVMDLKKYTKNYDKNYINFLKSRNLIVDCSGELLKNNLKALVSQK